jgi:hypothetical protein
VIDGGPNDKQPEVLLLLCLRQSEEKDPENDLNENVLLFSEATREEILPLSFKLGFITFKTLGVTSTSSSSIMFAVLEDLQ